MGKDGSGVSLPSTGPAVSASQGGGCLPPLTTWEVKVNSRLWSPDSVYGPNESAFVITVFLMKDCVLTSRATALPPKLHALLELMVFLWTCKANLKDEIRWCLTHQVILRFLGIVNYWYVFWKEGNVQDNHLILQADLIFQDMENSSNSEKDIYMWLKGRYSMV